jgi:pimeloyl-ACP methyl ester carboxylesterase
VAAAGRPTVVFFHGNGSQLADLGDLVLMHQAVGLGFYAIEYPGYGVAGGAPTERAIYDAAEVALVWLRNSLSVPESMTVLEGHSLGTGVAAEMAARSHGVRLILVSPFTSMDAAARFHFFLAGPFVSDHFDTASKASRIALPTLIVHWRDDEVVPVTMGEELGRLFPKATVRIIERGGHGDIFGVPEVITEVLSFAG